jgi:polysaccharide biosynthesis transport protein
MLSNANEYRVIEDSIGEPTIQKWRKRPRRLLLFVVVFLPLLAVAQIYIFLQPAVYSSKATVLTVAPTGIDEISAEKDTQHVVIQKQILIGQSLLEQTAQYLKEQNSANELTVDDLKAMLSVEPVAETNLVQLLAEGGQPHILQQTVNAWIAVYLRIRAHFISETTEKATAAISKEIALLEQQVEHDRKDVETFRLEHDILSEQSGDNQAHARLQGLNQSLNLALEEEVKTKAKLDTVRGALAEGKAVVPDNDSQALADMIKRAQQLREKVAGFQNQFTPEYIQLNPKLHTVVEQLAELEAKIGTKIKVGSRYAIQEAENNYLAARAAVKAIKLQMDEHKQTIAEYTSQFSKYQAMQEELLKLEALLQKTKQRLIEIEVKQRQQYPQVDVVEWASLPDKPIRPNYLLESVLAFAACLSLGLFVVWLVDYLYREQGNQSAVTLSGIHLYHDGAGREAFGMQDRRKKMVYDPVQLLQQDLRRELTQAEMSALFSAADPQASGVLCLLLNGFSIEEIANLTADDFDLEKRCIHVASRGRNIEMNRHSAALFNEDYLLAWGKYCEFNLQDIESMLTCAAIDAGLTEPEHINADKIRFSYMLYLVRQGIKLSDLAKVFGPISPARLVELGHFSPEQAGIPIEDIQLEFPVDI